MLHPYFDATRFRTDRGEGDAFLRAFLEADPNLVSMLYRQTDSALPQINWQQDYTASFPKALDTLVAKGQLRRFCELILDEPALGKILHSCTQAIIGAGDLQPENADEVLLTPSTPFSRDKFAKDVVRWAMQMRGLTLLISPYATHDVHRVDDPRAIGGALLTSSMNDLVSDDDEDRRSRADRTGKTMRESDMLSNMLVATASSYALTSNYNSVWDWLRVGLAADARELQLYHELGALARIWEECREKRGGKLNWDGGLLFLTFDASDRLEQALRAANVSYGLLQVLSDRRMRYYRLNEQGEMTSVHVFQPPERGSSVGSHSLDQELFKEDVVILKLMGYAQHADARPPLGLESIQNLPDGLALPEVLKLHLKNMPFVMLGGGLLDPFVSLTFIAHVWPAFNVDRNSTNAPVRGVVLHPSPDKSNVMRFAEAEINEFNPEWTNIFGLKSVVNSLPAMVSALAKQMLAEWRKRG